MRVPPHTIRPCFENFRLVLLSTTDLLGQMAIPSHVATPVNRYVFALLIFGGHHRFSGDEEREEDRSTARTRALVPHTAAPGLRRGPVILQR